MSIRFRAYWDFICLFGRKGKGKSVFSKYIIKSLNRYVIWDRHHEYSSGYFVYYRDRLREAFEQWKRIVYRPLTYSDEEFEEVCKFVLSQSNLTFIVEECDEHAHARGYSTPLFQRIIRGGRHQGIGLILISRRPAITHKDLRSQADYVISFQMHEEDDIKYVGSWMGIEPQKIKELPDYHSILFNANTHDVTMQGPCSYYE